MSEYRLVNFIGHPVRQRCSDNFVSADDLLRIHNEYGQYIDIKRANAKKEETLENYFSTDSIKSMFIFIYNDIDTKESDRTKNEEGYYNGITAECKERHKLLEEKCKDLTAIETGKLLKYLDVTDNGEIFLHTHIFLSFAFWLSPIYMLTRDFSSKLNCVSERQANLEERTPKSAREIYTQLDCDLTFEEWFWGPIGIEGVAQKYDIVPFHYREIWVLEEDHTIEYFEYIVDQAKGIGLFGEKVVRDYMITEEHYNKILENKD